MKEIFDALRKMSVNSPEKLNILEEEIDVELQMEYFAFSKKRKKEQKEKETFIIPDCIEEELDIDTKKQLLVTLASEDNPKAFRLIEEYLANPEPELRQWAIMALNESKMLLQSSLLEQNQVFISTGMGGKGNKLRYFVALIGKNESGFEEFQKNLIQNVFCEKMMKNNAEIEHLEFYENFACIKALLPILSPIQQLLKEAVSECNEFGDFLERNMIVTNVKTLSIDEIKAVIRGESINIGPKSANILNENSIDDE